jgi:hypothetical protein
MMIWAAAEGFRKWGDIELNKKQIDAKKKEDGNEPQAD